MVEKLISTAKTIELQLEAVYLALQLLAEECRILHRGLKR